MAYQPTDWKNREVERPRTFTLQENNDGTITLIPAEGKVTEPGTPIMAANMNKIENELVVLDKHFYNTDVHVTLSDKNKWNTIGLPTQIAGGTDLNTVYDGGLYIWSSGNPLVNAPMGGACYIQVLNRSSNDLPVQIFNRIYEDRMFIRARTTTQVGGAWTPWKEFAGMSDIKLINDKITSGSPTIGALATAGSSSVSVGSVAISASSAVALGASANAANSGVALGSSAKTIGNNSVAVGRFAYANSSAAVALGYEAVAIGQSEIMLGNGAGIQVKTPGTITAAGGKAFEIAHPHPDKNTTHMLRHTAVESPTAGDTLYRFKVEATLDGETVEVTLSDYFEFLNKDVDVYVSPFNHFGVAFGDVIGGTLHVTCEKMGTYNVLVIGTRKDNHETVQTWDIRGVEREIGENWSGETESFLVDEITEVPEITTTQEDDRI